MKEQATAGERKRHAGFHPYDSFVSLPLEGKRLRGYEMRLKMRVDGANQKHVKVTLFMGERTLANIGSLCLRLPEYQILGAVLSLGAGIVPDHLTVEHDDAVFRQMKPQEGG